MQFTCPKHPGYTLVVKDPEVDYSVPGRPRVIRAAVEADFAGAADLVEYQNFNEIGELVDGTYAAPRGGGFLDTEDEQRRLGWTDAERKLVEERLLELTDRNADGSPASADELRRRSRLPGFRDIELYTAPKPEAPWPNYDGAHHNEIAKLAAQTGVVAEALRYEQAMKNRPSVVEALQEKLELARGEEELTAA